MDQELTLLRLRKHTHRELLPFRAIVDAATPDRRRTILGWASFLDKLSQTLPGFIGRWTEEQAQRVYLRAFQGVYDVVLGYLVAHDELMEEELHSPSSFALNAEVNRRSVEMVEQNIKAASRHLLELKSPSGRWSAMCAVLDTVRVAHSLMHSLETEVQKMGHHGTIAETETERMLDLLLERKEWLRQQTSKISSGLTHSLPPAMLSEMTEAGRQRTRRAIRNLGVPIVKMQAPAPAPLTPMQSSADLVVDLHGPGRASSGTGAKWQKGNANAYGHGDEYTA